MNLDAETKTHSGQSLLTDVLGVGSARMHPRERFGWLGIQAGIAVAQCDNGNGFATPGEVVGLDKATVVGVGDLECTLFGAGGHQDGVGAIPFGCGRRRGDGAFADQVEAEGVVVAHFHLQPLSPEARLWRIHNLNNTCIARNVKGFVRKIFEGGSKPFNVE